MIILLEGADCSGKTTLAGEIRKIMPDAVYVHHTQETNSVGEFTHTINDAIDRQQRNTGVMGMTIIDRLWISEMIYGPIMRTGSRDLDGIVARLCHMAGVVTVMCVRKDMNRHLAHFHETAASREEYAREKIGSVIQAYYDLWYGRISADVAVKGTLYKQFTLFTPLRLIRAYYQYDMDQVQPNDFAMWLHEMLIQKTLGAA